MTILREAQLNVPAFDERGSGDRRVNAIAFKFIVYFDSVPLLLLLVSQHSPLLILFRPSFLTPFTKLL